MKTIFDRASQARILADASLDPYLRDLLRRRFAALLTIDGDLTDYTEYLIIEPDDTEAEIIREVGFSPLVDPNGFRFPSRRFRPFWDHLQEHPGWFELIVTFGSAFAYVLLIQDADGLLPALRELCSAHVE